MACRPGLVDRSELYPIAIILDRESHRTIGPIRREWEIASSVRVCLWLAVLVIAGTAASRASHGGCSSDNSVHRYQTHPASFRCGCCFGGAVPIDPKSITGELVSIERSISGLTAHCTCPECDVTVLCDLLHNAGAAAYFEKCYGHRPVRDGGSLNTLAPVLLPVLVRYRGRSKALKVLKSWVDV